MATEVEVGGIKFRGGKIFVILTALTTAGDDLPRSHRHEITDFQDVDWLSVTDKNLR